MSAFVAHLRAINNGMRPLLKARPCNRSARNAAAAEQARQLPAVGQTRGMDGGGTVRVVAKSLQRACCALSLCPLRARRHLRAVRAQQVSGSDGGLLVHDAHRVPQQPQLVRTTVCVALHDKHTV